MNGFHEYRTIGIAPAGLTPLSIHSIPLTVCHPCTPQSSCRRSRLAAAAASSHRRAQSEGPVNRAATSAAAASTAATAHRVRRVDHDEIRPKPSAAAAPISSQSARMSGRKVSHACSHLACDIASFKNYK